MNSTEVIEENLEKLPEDAWLVRPCELYKEEYKECDSFKGHFHQYFIHGKTFDCKDWKSDYDNCMLWRKTKDHKYLEPIIKSEQKRKFIRLKNMLNNDIWELRDKPLPKEEWNKPLPEWMTKRFSSSYLEAQKQIEQNPNAKIIGENLRCTIL